MKEQTKEREKTANDHLTLDEIGVQHDDMQRLIVAKSSDRTFDNTGEATRYLAWCIQRALFKMGLRLHDKMHPGIIESILKAKKVEIQQFKSNEHSGTYIYKDTELQYFISDIIIKNGKDVIIFHKPKYVVRTNVT